MVTRDLRFALDEKGVKALAPTLVGQRMSYWDDNRLLQGLVVAAEVKRDRYGSPYIEVQLEGEGSGEQGQAEPAAAAPSADVS